MSRYSAATWEQFRSADGITAACWTATRLHKMNYELLSRRTEYFKESKEGVDTMCKLMDDYADKRARKAAEIAANERSINMATELWNDGMRDIEKIARLTKLPLDEVKKLFDTKSA